MVETHVGLEAAACRDLYLVGHDVDNPFQHSVITPEQRLLAEHACNLDEISPGTCPRGLKVGASGDLESLTNLVLIQIRVENKERVDHTARRSHFIPPPVVADKVVLQPEIQ